MVADLTYPIQNQESYNYRDHQKNCVYFDTDLPETLVGSVLPLCVTTGEQEFGGDSLRNQSLRGD